MQRRYNFALATVAFFGLAALMAGVDAQAQIAFASDRAGHWEIYVMSTNGKNPQNLTSST